MKIILSRKGFDSGSGGMPSPIFPDGTMLSMPIPSDDLLRYQDIIYQDKSYQELIKQLKESFDYEYCHLDPDLRKDVIKRSNKWQAVLGQAGAALTHLDNQGVKEGDIFIFFGWFQKTEYDKNGHLRFIKKSPQIHVIYGYMQVGKIERKYTNIKEYDWHPHADKSRSKSDLNALYIASQSFIDTSLDGYGTFKFSKELVLTKDGHSRSRWMLPSCLVNKDISYHSKDSYKEGYFQSAMRGQEFVVEADEDIIKWVKNLIKNRSGD